MPTNWCTSQMSLHKITLSIDYNLWLKRVDTKSNKLINQNSFKFPKLLSYRIRKRYCKTLGTSVINSLLFPFSPIFIESSNIPGRWLRGVSRLDTISAIVQYKSSAFLRHWHFLHLPWYLKVESFILVFV